MIVHDTKFQPVRWGPAAVGKPTLKRESRREAERRRPEQGPQALPHPHLHVFLDHKMPVASVLSVEFITPKQGMPGTKMEAGSADGTGMVVASGHSPPSSGVHFYPLARSSMLLLSSVCETVLAGRKFSLLQH